MIYDDACEVHAELKIRRILDTVDRACAESLCAAHRAIWHAELDLMGEGDYRLVESQERNGRDFDDYDILDTKLAQHFDEKVDRLLSVCKAEGIVVS